MVVGVVVGISEMVVNVVIDVIAREVVVCWEGEDYVPSSIIPFTMVFSRSISTYDGMDYVFDCNTCGRSIHFGRCVYLSR